MNEIEKLQLWYRTQCDGSWEHEYGIAIDTLDNPGWSVMVDLVGTNLHSMQMEPLIEDVNEAEWLHCKIENGKFVGMGGPLKLNTIIGIFLDLIPSREDV